MLLRSEEMRFTGNKQRLSKARDTGCLPELAAAEKPAPSLAFSRDPAAGKESRAAQ